MTSDPGVSETEGDKALEIEFREAYRKPGARYLGITWMFGSATALALYGIDAVGSGLPWLGGAQSMRLILAGVSLSLAVLCWTRPAFTTRHYALQ